MYEYEKKYEEGRLLCQNCRKGFHAVAVAAPPGGFLVRGKDCKYYSGYGFFHLHRLGYSFLGDDKEVGRGKNTGKKNDVVVEISDDSDDDEWKKMNVKNETVPRNIKREVKAEGSNSGGARGVIKRVKSVPMNAKKMAGRGVKGKKVEKVNVESGNGGDCGIGSDGQNAVEDEELEFFDVDDDIFVGLRDIC